VRLVRDLTGRFHERPHYEAEELDVICQTALIEHAKQSERTLEYPVSTDVLQTLIEAHAASLDLYADLSEEGPNVEGVTDFRPGARPTVRISAALSEDGRREARLRTTLAHEFGHVHLHDKLFQGRAEALDLFAGAECGDAPADSEEGNFARCKRESIVGAAAVDWMEWQAGYVCGALLMPRRELLGVVHRHLREAGHFGRLVVGSDAGRAVIGEVMRKFFVSAEAARVRLLVLGMAVEEEAEGSVFG
jgi:hypothetical protein